MKWLEIIRVRANDSRARSLAIEFLDQMDSCLSDETELEAELYSHATLPGDLEVTLTWRDTPPQPTGSFLGLNLSTALRQAGLVDHSIWIAQEKPTLVRTES